MIKRYFTLTLQDFKKQCMQGTGCYTRQYEERHRIHSHDRDILYSRRQRRIPRTW